MATAEPPLAMATVSIPEGRGAAHPGLSAPWIPLTPPGAHGYRGRPLPAARPTGTAPLVPDGGSLMPNAV